MCASRTVKSGSSGPPTSRRSKPIGAGGVLYSVTKARVIERIKDRKLRAFVYRPDEANPNVAMLGRRHEIKSGKRKPHAVDGPPGARHKEGHPQAGDDRRAVRRPRRVQGGQ